jgi:hypothetical protein
MSLKQMTGTITVAQEGRFRINSDDGRSTLFVLAHDAPLEPQDLPPLVARNARLTVHYSAAQGVVAALAHDLTLPGGRARGHTENLSAPRSPP